MKGASRLKGSKILGLGVTYKRDTNDIRESPALQVLEGLREKGARSLFLRPVCSDLLWSGVRPSKSIELTPNLLQSMDCVAILTDHSAFDYSMVAKFSSMILDTRNAFKDFPRSDLNLL